MGHGWEKESREVGLSSSWEDCEGSPDKEKRKKVGLGGQRSRVIRDCFAQLFQCAGKPERGVDCFLGKYNLPS